MGVAIAGVVVRCRDGADGVCAGGPIRLAHHVFFPELNHMLAGSMGRAGGVYRNETAANQEIPGSTWSGGLSEVSFLAEGIGSGRGVPGVQHCVHAGQSRDDVGAGVSAGWVV